MCHFWKWGNLRQTLPRTLWFLQNPERDSTISRNATPGLLYRLELYMGSATPFTTMAICLIQIAAKAIGVDGPAEPMYSSQTLHLCSGCHLCVARHSPCISGTCTEKNASHHWLLCAQPLCLHSNLAQDCSTAASYHACTQTAMYRPSFSTDGWKDG